MDDISIRDCKIKYIYSFFEYKYNEEISNKVLSIVDNYTIEYTVNNNGIFINLNVINDEVLDIIYDCIVSTKHIELPDKFITNDKHISKSNVTDQEQLFVSKPDVIKYTKVDYELLTLSKQILTI